MKAKSSDVFRYEPEYVQVATEKSSEETVVVSNVYVASCVVDGSTTSRIELKGNLLNLSSARGEAMLSGASVVPVPEDGGDTFRRGVLFYSYELKLCVNYETIEEETEDSLSTVHRSVYKRIPMKGSCKMVFNSDVPLERARMLVVEQKDAQVNCLPGNVKVGNGQATVEVDASVSIWMNVLEKSVELGT